MKKLISLILSVLVVLGLCSSISVSANDKTLFYDGEYHTYEGNFFSLKVNGKTLNCDVPPIVFNDYSVVPARDVFESLGAEVLWDAENERVTVKHEKTNLILTINKQTAYKNGTAQTMPIVPKIINGKTMIPARFVSTSLGFSVDFDPKTDTISIKTEEKKEEIPKIVYKSRIMSYSVNEEDEHFSVTFNLSSADIKHKSFILVNPYRLCVDLELTDRAVSVKDAEYTESIISKMRFGQQADGTLRVVFDMPQKLEYNVSKSGKKIMVTIGKEAENTTPTEPTEPEIADKPNENEEPTEPEEPVIVEIDIPAARTITIDAGHGGQDPGAIYTDENGVIWFEKDINLGVALKVRDILLKNNVQVVMTRDDDEFLELKERAEIANEEKTALFVSIHTNSIDAESPNGIETWGSLNINTILCGVNDKLLAQNVQKAVIKSTNAKDRGIKDSETLAVLKYSVMPSVLIEVGFISNTNERALMFSNSYRDKLAQGIAEGILKTFSDMGV